MRSTSDTNPGYSIRRASWDGDKDALALVRRHVFVEEQGVPETMEWDSADAYAEHLLACNLDQHPIGTARVLPSGQIGRMAVLRAWRGRGVGTSLLREALRIAQEPGRPRPFLHAQSSALSFYVERGFRPRGREFQEAGIPHRLMIHQGKDLLNWKIHESSRKGAKTLMSDDDTPNELSLDAPIVPGRRDWAGPRTFDGHLAIRDAGTELARQARRELLIFSHDLDPRCYDHRPFLAEVQRLALERPHLPVRALVIDARLPVTHGHRMIDLARRLTSRIEIRRVAEDDRDRIDAFLLVDARGYCRRPVADRHEAIFASDDPPGARRLQADFQAMWEQAEPDTELRRLHL